MKPMDATKQGEVRSRPVLPFVVVGGLGIIVMIAATSWPVRLAGLVFTGLAALIFVLLKDRVVLEIYDSGCVYFESEHHPQQLLWDDIRWFAHVKNNQTADHLRITLNDGTEINIPLLNISQGLKLFRAHIGDKEHTFNEFEKRRRSQNK